MWDFLYKSITILALKLPFFQETCWILSFGLWCVSSLHFVFKYLSFSSTNNHRFVPNWFFLYVLWPMAWIPTNQKGMFVSAVAILIWYWKWNLRAWLRRSLVMSINWRKMKVIFSVRWKNDFWVLRKISTCKQCTSDPNAIYHLGVLVRLML